MHGATSGSIAGNHLEGKQELAGFGGVLRFLGGNAGCVGDLGSREALAEGDKRSAWDWSEALVCDLGQVVRTTVAGP